MPFDFLRTSTDTSIPKSHPVCFPDRCVVCSCDKPATQVRLAADSDSWFSFIDWLWTKPFFLRIPACRGCGTKLRLLRWVSELLTWSCVFSMIYLVWPQVKPHVAPAHRTWVYVAFLFGCFVPQIIWEFVYVLPFDFKAREDHVVYEFASPVQAISFVVANQHAPWVKWNGTIVDNEWKQARLKALAQFRNSTDEEADE